MACCFCGSSSTVDGGALLSLSNDLFAHELCVAFSSGYEIDPEEIPDDYSFGCLQNVCVESVLREAQRGRRIRCSLCGERGASIGCFTCSKKCFHYPCAARAGLVEWHWWRSGHRKQVAHCTQHLDPRCSIEFEGEWYEAAAVDGPRCGRFFFIYVDPPFEQEDLALNQCVVVCAKPPTGAARWASFKALCDANLSGKENLALTRKATRRRCDDVATTRCVVSRAPLDCPKSTAAVGEARVVARPLVATSRERELSAAATLRAVLKEKRIGIPKTAPNAAATQRTRRRPGHVSAASSSHIAWIIMDLALNFLPARDVCTVRVCGSQVYEAVDADRLFRTELERELGSEAARIMIACFQGRHLEALRWSSGNSLRFAALPMDHAGSELSRVTSRRAGTTSSWSKAGLCHGDVTIACVQPLPRHACVCWEFHISRIESDSSSRRRDDAPEAAFGICTGLSRPSPFWLGREPRSGVAGKSLALSSLDEFYTTLGSTTTLAAPSSSIRQQPVVATIEAGDRIGFLVDTRSTPAIVAVYRNGHLLFGEISDPSSSLEFPLDSVEVFPASSLWHPRWRISISPAIPQYAGDERVPLRLVSIVSSS